MRRSSILLAVAVLVGGLASAAGASASVPAPAALGRPAGAPAPVDPLVRAAQADAGPGGSLDVVLSLDGVASPALERRLADFGSWSRAFRHIPAAGLRIPVRRLEALRHLAGVRGIYLDRRLSFDADESHRLLNTDRAERQLGVTGKGVTIAVLDSGVDFTHPDLAPALRANVKMVGFPEAGGVMPVAGTPISDSGVTPVAGAPTSDSTSGHGTHVAGDAAGRGTMSNGRYRGIAPGADLVGVGCGEAISVFNVVEGFDWILGHKDEYGIRIVTNSWGRGFAPFDPAEPIQVATRAAADAGLVVLFAMGNDGNEMTMNPYAAAPWVIPVAAGSQAGGVTDFSSAGIEADVLGGAFAGSDVHGDPRRPLHLGLYHPAVAAPGQDIVSTRARNTLLPARAAAKDAGGLSAAQLPYYTTMSGTSMATPETAGLAALVLEADPSLTPGQVRTVLQVTARPLPGVAFEKQGYGYADASAAVDLAQSLRSHPLPDVAAALEARQSLRDRSVLDGLDHPAHTLAFEEPIPATAGHVSHAVEVPEGSRRLKVVVTTSDGVPAVGSPTPWELTVTDAAGRRVGGSAETTQRSRSGTIAVDLALRPAAGSSGWAWGTWRVTLHRGIPLGPPPGGPPHYDVLPGQATAIVVALYSAR